MYIYYARRWQRMEGFREMTEKFEVMQARVVRVDAELMNYRLHVELGDAVVQVTGIMNLVEDPGNPEDFMACNTITSANPCV